jgi:hypothetical protein
LMNSTTAVEVRLLIIDPDSWVHAHRLLGGVNFVRAILILRRPSYQVYLISESTYRNKSRRNSKYRQSLAHA